MPPAPEGEPSTRTASSSSNAAPSLVGVAMPDQAPQGWPPQILADGALSSREEAMCIKECRADPESLRECVKDN